MGLQLAPDFATSQWVYLTYSELDNATRQDTQVVARYRMQGNTADPLSRQEIITWVAQRDQCCHSSGSLYFGPDGSLYISTGDNTNPFASDGFTPIDERPGRQPWDAQRTSANTNDLNGKILRIRPERRHAGLHDPGGNLFAPGTAQTRPEIFAMGFRNPFRFTVDPETGWVLMGDYGPDARRDRRRPRPAGQRRVQHRHRARQLRLALLRPRQHAVQRLQLPRPARPARCSTARRRSTTRRTTPA